MKKFFSYAMAAAMLVSFASCDEEKNHPVDPVAVTTGMYVINAGSSWSKIPGSVTAVDFKTGAHTPEMRDAFLEANGIEPGELCGAVIYGSKMYIASNASNMIWVVNKENMKLISQIQPTGEGKDPRYLAAKDGKVYATLFTGYVCRIDTTSLKIDKEVKVGPNPEEPAIVGNKLYVPNSDGWGTTANSSISVIDLATMAESKITDPAIVNPTGIQYVNGNIFVLCMGNYKDIKASVYKLEGSKVKYVCPGTRIAVSQQENQLYVIDAPYNATVDKFTYKKYDAATLQEKGNMIVQEAGKQSVIEYPAQVFINPSNSDVIVLSYYLSGQYPSYTTPGYANVYDKTGKFVKRYPVGPDPKFVCFK